MIIEEVKTLLSNRKSFLNMQKSSAVQSGDIDRVSELEDQLQQVEELLVVLGVS